MSVCTRGSSFGRWMSVVLWALAVGAVPTSSAAQDREGHWGVSASYTPNWTMMQTLRDALFEEDEEGNLEGSEFTIGLVRGSTLGGHWGVSFVRKPFKDGSGVVETDTNCLPGPGGSTQCLPELNSTLTEGAYLNGVEFHAFIPFATIRNRAQIGLGVGGGIARVNGNVVVTRDGFDVVFNPPNQFVTVPVHEVEVRPAQEELLTMFPLAKLEAAGSVILAPGLKFTVAGGLNFPAISARFGLVYLFGAR